MLVMEGAGFLTGMAGAVGARGNALRSLRVLDRRLRVRLRGTDRCLRSLVRDSEWTGGAVRAFDADQAVS